ncbi:MAG: helix-turn-helix domain-containing protein [Alphaproteobacteria bacterium]|nr:helix-turn-helix domain-containing protein [Alphaproteobacteria bacterium]
MRKQRHQNYTNCPVEAALDVVGGKWKAVILFRLLEGTKRFNQLRRLLPNVTQRMMTNQLRELERDGLVRRKVYAQVPPKVEYSLTDLGKTLTPALHELRKWGEEHMLGRLEGGEAVGDSTKRGQSPISAP